MEVFEKWDLGEGVGGNATRVGRSWSPSPSSTEVCPVGFKIVISSSSSEYGETEPSLLGIVGRGLRPAIQISVHFEMVRSNGTCSQIIL